MRDPAELAWPFPMPDSPALAQAYLNLYLAGSGNEKTKQRLGGPIELPRPWDPPTCTDKQLRAELWMWLDRFVRWFNHEYVWDPATGRIPPCWPQHPHLIHELAVLADQRRLATIDLTASRIEELNRYSVPAFLDRMKARLKGACDDTHTPWPAARRYQRDTSTVRLTPYSGQVVVWSGGLEGRLVGLSGLLVFVL